MYFETVFNFYVFLYHFVGHSFFGLVAFRSFSNIIKWNFSLTLAKLNFYVDMSVWLFVGKQYYRLHMNRHPKLINRAYLSKLISSLTQILQIPRQGCRVAAHVDDTLRCHVDQSVQKYLIAALSRWIHDNNVCMGAVAAFLIYIWNDFLCLADKELGICDPVDLGVMSCIIYSLWNDLHSVYLLCLLCEEQGYGSYSAVHIPHGLIA